MENPFDNTQQHLRRTVQYTLTEGRNRAAETRDALLEARYAMQNLEIRKDRGRIPTFTQRREDKTKKILLKWLDSQIQHYHQQTKQ